MATYNGEKYIAQQIESILQQTHQDYILYISDDASTDNTFAIVEQFACQFPEKIKCARKTVNSGGAKHNFFNMMIEHKDDYIMLCDQDDIWLPNKIEVTLYEMLRMESQYGVETPILVHTDLEVVDEDILHVISPSLKETMRLDFSCTQFEKLISKNTLTGCTAMYNRSLANMIAELPVFMIVHDWWLMLIASAFGKIGALDTKTVLYRQHSNNEVGAKNMQTLGYKINKLLNYRVAKNALNDTYVQAQSFLDLYQNKLTDEQMYFLETYCSVSEMPKYKRWHTMCQIGVFGDGLLRKIVGFIFT